MGMRKRIALLAGQPEEGCQNLFIHRFLKQAFSEDCDVCIFAMYQKYQTTQSREWGESNIFSLVEFGLFEEIVVLTDTIQTPGVLDGIKKELRERYEKKVVFVDGESETSFEECVRHTSSESSAEVFDFNENTLEDDLLMQTELTGFLQTICSYARQIRPFESFHICLNGNWQQEISVKTRVDGDAYSEKMWNVLRCGASGGSGDKVDLEAEFDRKELLPELLKAGGTPRAYYFTPLFFGEYCFGYAAVNYGVTIKCYDAAYKKWLSSIMRGLECFRRTRMLLLKSEDRQGAVSMKQEEKFVNPVSEAGAPKSADKMKEQRQARKTLSEAERALVKKVADILDNNRLIYYFQPIVDAVSGEIFAYEALMRADVEEPVSPLDILKWAEYMGRLSDVERATFSNVLSYVETHEELFANRKIFINSIPGIQIKKEDAVIIQEKLEKVNGKVVVELTEQAELNDKELDELKEKYEKLGVDTAVDDYGTGYSNVYNLLRYMPNFVKIDRMLLADIQLSAQKQHFVKEIIEFSHNNHITVLAEGVETADELNMVTVLGVDLIQGYYTAKPREEVIPQIDYAIQNEIIQYGQFALSKSKRKIYTPGQDEKMSLAELAVGHYSKIKFTCENGARSASIAGQPDFLANIEIEFEDSYSGRLEIKDIDLAVHNEQPSIRLGNDCDVTLVLRGSNVLEQGGILVPESSRLTIQGEGDLAVRQIAINGYGIGNDKDGKHGELYFEQDGLIEIQGNTMHGVGIGAGYGGDIHVNRGRYSIQLSGEEAVGIGSLYSDVNMSIEYCALDINMKNFVNVGIGSLKGNVTLAMRCASIKGLFNANQCVCVGTLDGKFMKFHLEDGTVDLNAQAEHLCGIGNLRGGAAVDLLRFSLKLSAKGKETIAMGNVDKTAQVHARDGEMDVYVQNKMDYDIGAAVVELVNGSSKFILNGKEIIRKNREE